MKLFYFKDEFGRRNFGDDLNPWIFNKLFTGLFNSDDTEIFIGIGTILNNFVPDSKKKYVFSSGAGYGQGIQKLDSSWKIYCVRGPLTAEKLYLSPDLALIDGAVLLRHFYKPLNTSKLYRYSYMPHIAAAEDCGESWAKVCAELGFGYIDPRGTVETVLDQINSTETLITEAMHGAIAAETLRIPWIPVKSTSIILEFKWIDWCSSIKVDYNPIKIIPLWDSHKSSFFNNGKRYLKHRYAVSQMKSIVRNITPLQSEDRIFFDLLNRLDEKVEIVRHDLMSNRI